MQWTVGRKSLSLKNEAICRPLHRGGNHDHLRSGASARPAQGRPRGYAPALRQVELSGVGAHGARQTKTSGYARRRRDGALRGY